MSENKEKWEHICELTSKLVKIDQKITERADSPQKGSYRYEFVVEVPSDMEGTKIVIQKDEPIEAFDERVGRYFKFKIFEYKPLGD